LDKNYGRAYAMIAKAYIMIPKQGEKGWPKKIGLTYEFCILRSRHYLQLAMKNPTDISHQVAAMLALARRKYEKAMIEAEKAIEINPNSYEANSAMGQTLIYVGRPKEAIIYFKKSLKSNPFNPGWPLFNMGRAHFSMGQFNEAIDLIKRAIAYYPKNINLYLFLAASYAHLDRDQEARDALMVYLEAISPFTPDLNLLMSFWPFKKQRDSDLLAEGLVKAGLTGPPSSYCKISKQNKLTGKEIKKLFFGHTMKGTTSGGKQWSLSRDKKGKFTLTGPWGNYNGKSWIEGDRMFMQWEKLYEGRKYDYEIYRNLSGTRENMNEYCSVSDFAVVPFSIVD
jgi:tetratricopeptide (TPR) repeat protein